MPNHELTHTNHNGEEFVLNDDTYRLIEPPIGLLLPSVEPRFVAMPTADPAQLYQGHLQLPRKIVVPLYVYGTDKHDIVDRLGLLWEHLDEDAGEDEKGVLTYTSFNSLVRAVEVVLAKDASFEKWITGAMHQRGAARIDVPLETEAATLYDPTEAVFSGAFNGATPVVVACSNGGNRPAWPRITYAGVVSQPKVTDSRGVIFKIEGDLAAGDELYINFDPAAFEVTYTPSGGSATSWMGLRSQASQLIQIAKGVSNLTFEAASGTGTIVGAFNPRYSVHGIRSRV